MKFRVPPDVGLFAQKLADADLENAMKVRDPTRVTLDEGLVVQVGVANERVFLEIHIHRR
jgi:hypothetical protein